jgi:transcriptional regulator with XRE-family HTH domain
LQLQAVAKVVFAMGGVDVTRRSQGVRALDLNPVLTPVRDLGEFIREQRTAAQISIRGLAEKAGVSNPYLSQVERGLRRPSADILAQIAHGLSISVESLLAKAGILENADTPDVVSAIRSDPVLTERQKAALIDVYAAFRKQTESTTVEVPAVGPAASNASSVIPAGPGPIDTAKPASNQNITA